MIAEASANAWHGFWGVVLGLLTVALVAWLVAKLAGVEIKLPVSDAMLGAVVAGIILLFALIKVLVDDFTAAAAYVGLVLAAIVAVGAWLNVQEAGGVRLPQERGVGHEGRGDERRGYRRRDAGARARAVAAPVRTRSSSLARTPIQPPPAPDPTPPPPAPSPEPPPPPAPAPDDEPPAQPPPDAPDERTS